MAIKSLRLPKPIFLAIYSVDKVVELTEIMTYYKNQRGNGIPFLMITTLSLLIFAL